MQPPEAPDEFDDAWASGGYDAASGSAARSWEKQSASGRAPGGGAPTVNQLSYAAPGSNSSSMNPASTVAFMFHMGYPPPPIALESLRRLIENLTEGPGTTLNLNNTLFVTDEILRSPYRISPCVLFVIQQRLHSSKPDRVSLAIQLLDSAVKNCGIEFLRHVNKEFMKSLSSVIKTTSFKDRTITGQMKKLEKYITRAPTATGVATDPRVHKIRKMALAMIQNWVEAFGKYPNQIGAVVDAYNALKAKGINFPPRDPAERYVTKDSLTAPPPARAASPPALAPAAAERWDEPVFGGAAPPSVSSDRMEGFGHDPSEEPLPLSDQQFQQVESIVALLRSEPFDTEKVIMTLDRVKGWRPELERVYKVLNVRVQRSTSRKLRSSDPAVIQLNALMTLDAEYKKRRGTRLLFDGENVSVSTAPVSPPSPEVAAPRPVNLLDDLLDAEERAEAAQQLPAKAADEAPDVFADDEDEFATTIDAWGSKPAPKPDILF